MKKCISALLALCLACMMLPALAEEVSPVGTWHLVRGEKDGVVIETAGTMDMVISVNEDGTCRTKATMYGMDLEDAGTWEAADGGISVTDSFGNVQTLLFAGEELKMEQDGMSLFFSRTEPGVPDADVAGKVPAEAAEQFNGLWKITRVLVMGTTASAENMGLDQVAGMEILNGHITEHGQIEGKPVQAEVDCEFRDGFLVTPRDVNGVVIEITYALLEDGTLGCFMDIMGMEVTMIYERTDAATEEPAA